MIDKTIEQKRISLQAMGLPEDRAQAKAESTAVGYLAVIPGLLFIFASVGLLIFSVVTKAPINTLMVVAIAVLALVPGVLLSALGFSLISRDAAPWIAKAGEWLVNTVMRWRGK